jgi:excisionase family DNA binding protein
MRSVLTASDLPLAMHLRAREAILADQSALAEYHSSSLHLQFKGTTMNEIPHLISVPAAAKLARVARNTMLLAAKNGKVKAVRLGRDWFVYEDDIERWKQEDYQPTKVRKNRPSSDEDVNMT